MFRASLHPDIVDMPNYSFSSGAEPLVADNATPESQRTLGQVVLRSAVPISPVTRSANSVDQDTMLLNFEVSGRWQDKAACRGEDVESFFLDSPGGLKHAKEICSRCEVRLTCLDEALKNDERYGVWGGLSERERRRLKKRSI